MLVRDKLKLFENIQGALTYFSEPPEKFYHGTNSALKDEYLLARSHQIDKEIEVDTARNRFFVKVQDKNNKMKTNKLMLTVSDPGPEDFLLC